MIEVLTVLAMMAAGNASPLPFQAESLATVQLAQSNRVGKYDKLLLVNPKTVKTKKKGSKKAAGGYKAPKTAKPAKTKLPKQNAIPQDIYNSDLVDQTLGPVR